MLVSTDPASNLAHVFGLEIGQHEPTSIAEVPGLFALNIDPAAAAQSYRDRIVGPARGQLPTDVVRFDHIIFDAAPTGLSIAVKH